MTQKFLSSKENTARQQQRAGVTYRRRSKSAAKLKRRLVAHFIGKLLSLSPGSGRREHQFLAAAPLFLARRLGAHHYQMVEYGGARPFSGSTIIALLNRRRDDGSRRGEKYCRHGDVVSLT